MEIEFNKIQAHCDDEFNDEADELARAGADQYYQWTHKYS